MAGGFAGRDTVVTGVLRKGRMERALTKTPERPRSSNVGTDCGRLETLVCGWVVRVVGCGRENGCPGILVLWLWAGRLDFFSAACSVRCPSETLFPVRSLVAGGLLTPTSPPTLGPSLDTPHQTRDCSTTITLHCYITWASLSFQAWSCQQSTSWANGDAAANREKTRADDAPILQN